MNGGIRARDANSHGPLIQDSASAKGGHGYGPRLIQSPRLMPQEVLQGLGLQLLIITHTKAPTPQCD